MSIMPSQRVDIVDPLQSTELCDWLEDAKGSTIFHSTSWARVLAESYGYKPVCVVLSERGNCRGCLPVIEVDSAITGRRGVCVSFSDYCGALIESPGDFKLLFDNLLEYGRIRRWRHIEFRGESCLGDAEPSKVYAHHVVELSDDEAVMLSRLRNSTARNIQKAVKEGVTIDIGRGLEALLDFYHLHCLTRRRQGLPPQPRSYFEKLHEHVIAKGLGFTALARQGNITVAGMVCLHFGRNAIYKYGASDTDFQHLRANNLLFWETMKKCGREGFDYFSLGRTDLDNEGLLNFKNGWGGTMTSLNYYRYDLARSRFVCDRERNLKACREVLKRLPVKVLRMLGEFAYRHVG